VYPPHSAQQPVIERARKGVIPGDQDAQREKRHGDLGEQAWAFSGIGNEQRPD